MMPEEFQHLVYLIEANAWLALFQIADKSQANAYSSGKLDLSEPGSPAQVFDLLAERYHVRHIISYQV